MRGNGRGGERNVPFKFLSLDVEVGLDAFFELGLNLSAVCGSGLWCWCCES